MDPEQMAAMIASTGGDLDKTASFINAWKMPVWGQLDSEAVKDLTLSKIQQEALQRFAGGDSPMAQMMRGFAVRNAVKATARLQRKLQRDMLDPARREEVETGKFRADLREHLNVLQNQMYNRGNGVGSAEFKEDYKKFLAKLGLDPASNNFFYLLDPGSKKKDPGEFYSWPTEKQNLFYKMAGKLFQKHVTGYGFDSQGRFRNLDPNVPRNNAMFSDWYQDYDRIRDTMAVNARERAEDEIESYVPSLEELAESHVTGRLVGEKHRRKVRLDRARATLASNSQALAGQRPAFRQHLASGSQPVQQMMFDESEAAVYMVEGGVLDRATRIGQTGSGRPIVAGEAGREYVVPEGKTRDLGNGVKVFDADELGNKGVQADIWTDGSHKEGRGGWGAVLRTMFQGKEVTKELAGRVMGASSGEMEAQAALEALRAMKAGKSARVYSDYQALVGGMLGDPKRRPRNIAPILSQIDDVIRERNLSVQWQWVGGHMGKRLNERAHALAYNQTRKKPLMLARGGIIDYEAYANAPTSDYQTAMLGSPGAEQRGLQRLSERC
jgi:ribonuclease HI